jgi:predicted nucleic acid-binding protein
MKTYLFDTSVLIAAIIEKHPRHEESFHWLKAAVNGKIGFVISAHTLAELFSVLTGMPASPRISPSQAKLLIEKNTETAKVIEISARDYHHVISMLAELNLSGGIIYDALVAYSAKKAKADYILTFNENDFRKFEIKRDFPKIISPYREFE